jgi:hypothetical protein
VEIDNASKNTISINTTTTTTTVAVTTSYDGKGNHDRMASGVMFFFVTAKQTLEILSLEIDDEDYTILL